MNINFFIILGNLEFLKQGHFICFNLCSEKRTTSVEKVASSFSNIPKAKDGDKWTLMMEATQASDWGRRGHAGLPLADYGLIWVTTLDTDWTVVSSPRQVRAQVTASCEKLERERE